MHSRATDRRSASKCQGKWPDQTLDQAFGLPEVLVAVSTSRLSCKRAGENANIDAGLGFIWRISAEIDAPFETIGRERPDAIFVGVSPFLNGRRVQLAQLAAFHRLPAVYAVRDYAEVGGLMSYGSDVVGGFRQVGVYAGRILKGAKPADLPVVQSSKFELVINASPARMLGLTVPEKLLVAADEVIE